MRQAVPRLHLVADEAALQRQDFVELAAALLESGGEGLALHLRAHGRPGGWLHERAAAVAPLAAAAGAWLVLNDRVDVALALAATQRGVRAVQLGVHSLPVGAVRALVGTEARIGYSAHASDEARAAAADGADWLLLGTIYATPSHPGRPGAGPGLVAETAARLREQGGAPIIAIGGVTAQRVSELRAAGTHGVAVLRGIWSAPEPLAALEEYMTALAQVPLESKGQ